MLVAVSLVYAAIDRGTEKSITPSEAQDLCHSAGYCEPLK